MNAIEEMVSHKLQEKWEYHITQGHTEGILAEGREGNVKGTITVVPLERKGYTSLGLASEDNVRSL